MFLPGTGIPVLAPDDPKVASAAVILVANSNYLPEIQNKLAEKGYLPKLLPV